jgi:hypothetical protein
MSCLIVSRDFWPNAAAIGDGLILLSRMLSKNNKTHVATMSRHNLSELNKLEDEGMSNVSFHTLRPLTDSSSGILLRIIELVYFSFWLFFSLLKSKPSIVYVATNPPLLVPFVVAIYCKIFRKKYVYHVQDIHPEASSLLMSIPRFVFSILQAVDTWVLNNAYRLVTLTEDMKISLRARGIKRVDITLIENPSTISSALSQDKVKGIVFSGNAGRLQLMEIVLEAIERYLKANGQLKFCFVGAGIYKERILNLATIYQNFLYKGSVDGETAMRITSGYRWALLPIMPEVLSYAYPSKIPTYISAGCEIISVTSHETSLAKWLESSGYGKNVEPSVDALIKCFHKLYLQPHTDMSVASKKTFAKPNDFANNLFKLLNDDK